MSQIAAIIAIGVIGAGMVVMLGMVQTARTRSMTRRRLDEAIPKMDASHTLGTVSHNASNERVRRATEEIDVAEVKKAMDDARAMEEDG